MIGRLTDRGDPGRPDVSPNSLMIGFMFYLSADTAGIYELMKAINKLLALFSFNTIGGAFGPVGSLNATYTASDPEYSPTLGEDMFSSPKEVRVEWRQERTAQISETINFPIPPPDNFVLEVSVYPKPLPVLRTAQHTLKASPGGKPGKGTPQLTSYQIWKNHNGTLSPLGLFGGADRFSYPENFYYEKAVDTEGKMKKGFSYVHTFLPDDPSQPIPIHMLKDSSGTEPVYFLQRSFVIGKDDDKILTPLGRDSIKIKVEDLPKAVKISGTGSNLKIEEDKENPPTTYYFRVFPCSKFTDNTPFCRDILDEHIIHSEGDVVYPVVPQGQPSMVSRLQIPRETTALYHASLETALLCLLLSRPDLDDEYSSTPFLQEDKNKTLGIYSFDPKKYFSSNASIKEFRSKINSIVKRKAKEIIKKSGPLSANVEEFVVNNSKELREFNWRLYDDTLANTTLRDCFGLTNNPAFNDTDEGVALNTKSMVKGQLSLERKLKMRVATSQEEIEFGTVPVNPVYKRIITKKKYEEELYKIYGTMNSPYGGAVPAWFDKSSRQQAEYLTNGVKKDPNGDPTIVLQKGVECVLLMEKGDYFQQQHPRKYRPTNGNQPLVYQNLGEIIKDCELPVSLNNQDRVYFVRNILLEYNNGLLLQQAAFVLNIAAGASDKRSESEWDMVRLGDNGVIEFIEKFLNSILNTVQAILDGLQGIIDAILKFIDFIQQRINEIQNLIRKINAIIQSIGLFDIPSASILFFASNGTDGVFQDLVNSVGKPEDPGTAVGFGGLGLMPIPLANVIVDIFFPDTDINGLVEDVVTGDF